MGEHRRSNRRAPLAAYGGCCDPVLGEHKERTDPENYRRRHGFHGWRHASARRADQGFKFGGWVMPYFDQAFGEELDRVFSEEFDLLLGRKDP
jgi:hypothetical protein